MEFLKEGLFLYVAAIAAVWAGLSFYYHVSSLRLVESERRRLEQAELNLARLLQLLDSPDYDVVSVSPHARRFLLIEYSRFLKDDVLSLLRLRDLGIQGMLYVGIFFASYFAMRLKSRLYCSNNDLRFLTGLGIGVFRSAARSAA